MAKKTVTINNKAYKMPEFNFGQMRRLESFGLSLTRMADFKNNIFTMVTAFVAVVADVEDDEADRLVEQHVLGGGDIRAIVTDCMEGLNESAFFKKFLASVNQAPKKGKTPTEDGESEA